MIIFHNFYRCCYYCCWTTTNIMIFYNILKKLKIMISYKLNYFDNNKGLINLCNRMYKFICTLMENRLKKSKPKNRENYYVNIEEKQNSLK